MPRESTDDRICAKPEVLQITWQRDICWNKGKISWPLLATSTPPTGPFYALTPLGFRTAWCY